MDKMQHDWRTTPEEDYYKFQGIKSSKSFSILHLTKRAQALQNIMDSPPQGFIFMVHCYGNDISWTFQAAAIFFAQEGFACFALDFEGHDHSQGIQSFVQSVDLVVQDCNFFLRFFKLDPQFQGLPCFLYGESIGGAICLLIYFNDPLGFGGSVLVAPMCRIADEVSPRWPIPLILTPFAKLFPTLAIVPTEDLLPNSVKVAKRVFADMNPERYIGKPKLGTVLELLRVTDDVNQRLSE